MNHLNVASAVAGKMGAVAVGGGKVPVAAGVASAAFKTSLREASGWGVRTPVVVAHVAAAAVAECDHPPVVRVAQALPVERDAVASGAVEIVQVKAVPLVIEPAKASAQVAGDELSGLGKKEPGAVVLDAPRQAKKSSAVESTPEKKLGKGVVAPVDGGVPVIASVGSVSGFPVADPIVAAGDSAVAAPVVGPVLVPIVAPVVRVELGSVQAATLEPVAVEQEPGVEGTIAGPLIQPVAGEPGRSVVAVPAAAVQDLATELHGIESAAGARVATAAKVREVGAKKTAPMVKVEAAAVAAPSAWNGAVEKPESKALPPQGSPQKVEAHVEAASPQVVMLVASPTAAPLANASVMQTPVKDESGSVPVQGGPVLMEVAQSVQPDGMRTLASTAQMLEVGVASGTHGWLRVRAEMSNGGEVVASVVASSTASAEALHRGLSALQEFLAHEQVGNVSVEVSAFQPASQEAGAMAESAGQAGGLNDQPQGERNQNRQQPVVEVAGFAEVDLNDTPAGMPFLRAPGGGGGWLSVRV